MSLHHIYSLQDVFVGEDRSKQRIRTDNTHEARRNVSVERWRHLPFGLSPPVCFDAAESTKSCRMDVVCIIPGQKNILFGTSAL